MGATGRFLLMRVRHGWTSRRWHPRFLTHWRTTIGWVLMGPNREKSSAQLCTFPNMPIQANTIPAHANTSPNMPARSCTAVESPAPTRKSLCESDLHRSTHSCSILVHLDPSELLRVCGIQDRAPQPHRGDSKACVTAKMRCCGPRKAQTCATSSQRLRPVPAPIAGMWYSNSLNCPSPLFTLQACVE